MNILTLINNLLNRIHKRDQNMRDRVAIMQLQFARLASLKMEFNDSTKLAMMILSLKECNESELLIASVKIMKEDIHLWKQRFSLFVQKAESLDDNMANEAYENRSGLGDLVQM